jgi:hypothetical protein
MLKQRVITALALLLVLIPAVLYPDPTLFLLLMLAFIAAAGWEWARMNQLAGTPSLLGAVFCVGICSGSWWLGLIQQSIPELWLVAGGLWVLMSAWVLRAGVSAWSAHPRWLRLFFGLLALCLTWLAVAQARLVGVNFLMSILALAWVADIGAYFAGRAYGGTVHPFQTGCFDQSGQKLGGRLGRCSRRHRFGFRLAIPRYRQSPPRYRALYTLLGQRGWGSSWSLQCRVHDGDECGWGLGGIVGQAQRRCEGQQCAAAGSWGCTRSH